MTVPPFDREELEGSIRSFLAEGWRINLEPERRLGEEF